MLFLSFLLIHLCNSCQPLVTKKVKVLPVYENYIVMSATPKFLSRGIGEDYKMRYKIPKKWNYHRLKTGEVLVMWSIPRGSREKLVFVDSGFHPVSVDTTHSKDGIEGYDDSSQRVVFNGTNSAFIREYVDLQKINSKHQ